MGYQGIQYAVKVYVLVPFLVDEFFLTLLQARLLYLSLAKLTFFFLLEVLGIQAIERTLLPSQYY